MKIRVNDHVALYHFHDDRYKTETLSLYYLFPTNLDKAAARYILPSVLSDGCRLFPDEYAIAERLEALYGADISHRVCRRGNDTEMCFSISCLDQAYTFRGEDIFPEVVSLLFSVLYDPLLDNNVFSERYILREKEQLKKELLDFRYRRDEYILASTRRLICDDRRQGFPLYGTVDEIVHIDGEAILDAYHTLCHAGMYMIYNGRRSPEEVMTVIPTARLKTQTPFSTTTRDAASNHRIDSVKYQTRHYPIAQSHITEGYVTDIGPAHLLWKAFPVFIQLFSDSPTALLFRDVRESTSACYACQATVDPTCGIMTTLTSVERGRERRISCAVRHALKVICEDRFSDADFIAARRAACHAFRAMMDRRDTYEMWLSRQIYLGNHTAVDVAIAELAGVTREDVVALAGHFVRRAHITFIGAEASDE